MRDSTGLLLVAGTGGHGEQLKRLRSLLKIKSATVIAEYDLVWDFSDDIYYCPRVVDYHRPTFVGSLVTFFKVAYTTFRVVRNKRSKIMVSTGPALAVPAALACKLSGIPVVHIESWSRISSVSNTTALMRRFRLANTVVYQYRDSVLAGQRNCEYWGHL